MFFQDTNPLAFISMPIFLYTSAKNDLDMNTITVPRKPHEAVSVICKLIHN